MIDKVGGTYYEEYKEQQVSFFFQPQKDKCKN